MSDKKVVAEAIYRFFLGFYTKAPAKADLAFVFGRNDLSLATAACSLWYADLVRNILVTGGVGKDSGDLTVPEADFLAEYMLRAGIPAEHILIENQATNGGQNTRFGMKKVCESGVHHKRIILVGHATNLARLWAAHTFSVRKDVPLAGLAVYELFAPDYELQEADYPVLIAEYQRLLDWPAKDWADQVALPPELTEAVRQLQ